MIQDPVNGRLLVLYIHILWFQVFLLLLFVPEEGCDLCAGGRLRSLCRRKAAIFVPEEGCDLCLWHSLEIDCLSKQT